MITLCNYGKHNKLIFFIVAVAMVNVREGPSSGHVWNTNPMTYFSKTAGLGQESRFTHGSSTTELRQKLLLSNFRACRTTVQVAHCSSKESKFGV